MSSSRSESLMLPPTLGSTVKTSNLLRFLQCVTPVPPSHFLPKESSVCDVNNQWEPLQSEDVVEYFTLADLWACYDEFSAYGVGTEVSLEYGDNITQYFIPYLSAIQLYTNKSTMASRSSPRPFGDTDEMEFENDSWDEDNQSEIEKLSRSLSENSAKTWDTISNDSNYENNGPSPKRHKLGSLYFQYIEMCSPYSRVPLREKVAELAKTCHGLMTLKNVDLSPASWMAVAWYPIYHIPSRKGEKDLEASFLTFHTLSSSFQDCGTGNEKNKESLEVVKVRAGGNGKVGAGGVPLSPFGLATYKMQGDLWVTHETDYEKLVYLKSAADSWLKQLNVYHHDFSFFTSHSAASI